MKLTVFLSGLLAFAGVVKAVEDLGPPFPPTLKPSSKSILPISSSLPPRTTRRPLPSVSSASRPKTTIVSIPKVSSLSSRKSSSIPVRKTSTSVLQKTSGLPPRKPSTSPPRKPSTSPPRKTSTSPPRKTSTLHRPHSICTTTKTVHGHHDKPGTTTYYKKTVTKRKTVNCHGCDSIAVTTKHPGLGPAKHPTATVRAAETKTTHFVHGIRRSTTASAALPAASGPPFAYRIAASSCAKNRVYRRKRDVYVFDLSHNNPSTGRSTGGQDAYFVSRVDGKQHRNDVAFGVADGVGGWADSGIDSADFSHTLCKTMAQVAKEATKFNIQSPGELLDHAYRTIVEDGKIAGGGSTACVAVASENGSFSVANLGDSGFVQIRPAAIHHNSNPQTHAFNTPYQLSIVPPRVLALSRAFGGSPLSDLPKAADLSTYKVRHGDVLVFATDGVWDNLSPEDILRVVTRQMTGLGAWVRHGEGEVRVSEKISSLTDERGISDGEGSDTDRLQAALALSIVAEAQRASLDTRRDGPFAREVQKHFPQEDFHGGKVDDICVVIAIVLSTNV